MYGSMENAENVAVQQSFWPVNFLEMQHQVNATGNESKNILFSTQKAFSYRQHWKQNLKINHSLISISTKFQFETQCTARGYVNILVINVNSIFVYLHYITSHKHNTKHRKIGVFVYIFTAELSLGNSNGAYSFRAKIMCNHGCVSLFVWD